MMRKTDGLSFPADGLPAIRELQELNAPTAAGGTRRTEDTPPARAERVRSGRRGRRPREAQTGRQGRGALPATGAPAGPPADPMAEAVRDLLDRPYTADPRTGPFTVSTVKIPTEVWERLGWVAKVTGRTKQEIIAEALREHFYRVLREGVAGRR